MRRGGALVASLILIPAVCLAARPVKQFCSVDAEAIVAGRPIPRRAFYFYKPVAGTPWVVYSDAVNSHSYLFNLETGEERPLPGGGEAVPISDGHFVTQPEGKALVFYSVDELLRSKENPPAVLRDATINDSYQSIGTLIPHSERLRVLTGRQGPFQFKDFAQWRDSTGRLRLKPLQEKPTPLCEGRLFSLPMISKNGREFAGYNLNGDWKDATMKVYEFDPGNGRCRMVLDLGLKTGKIDFSYDGDELAFTVMGPLHEEASSPSRSFFNEAYVYKRSTGELLRLTAGNERLRSYSFPAFRSDGKIVLLSMPRVDSWGNTFDLNNPNFKGQGDRIDIIDIHKHGDHLCPSGKSEPFNRLALSAISLAGHPQECRSAIHSMWVRETAERPIPPEELTEDELLTLCVPSAAAGGSAPISPRTGGGRLRKWGTLALPFIVLAFIFYRRYRIGRQILRMIIFYVPILLAGSGLCAPVEPYYQESVAPCISQEAEILRRWHATPHWADNGPETRLSPTGRIGVWLELCRESPGRITLSRLTPQTVTEVSFEEPLCTPKASLRVRRVDEEALRGSFTDEELRALVSEGGSGVIYAWSPKMPLSISSIDEIRQASTSLGIKVTYVLDPHADAELARRVAAVRHLDAGALRRIESIDLLYRGMLNHFPSVLVYTKGAIVGDYVPGSKSVETYRKIISARLTGSRY